MALRARWLSLVLLALTLAACREKNSTPTPSPTVSGPPRPFAMGLSSLPPELNEDSYADTFRLAGSVGEVVLIQRSVPWTELLTGSVSQETAQATQHEVDLAGENGLSLFVAIDPTDPSTGRNDLAGLPPELHGAGFADNRVRNAFVAYANYVAQNYHPAYLALGVEINTYARHQPDDFDNFVAAYMEAYDSVKRLSPATRIFPIFQFEELQGLLASSEGATPEPQWNLIKQFGDKIDLLAVSSYPSSVYQDASLIPLNYYTQIGAYTNKPTALASIGFSSGDDANSEEGEQQQGAFIDKALDAAQRLSMPLVVWFVSQDLTYTGQAPFDQLRHLGLRRQDGSPKVSWLIWQEASQRRFVERTR